MSFGRLRIPSYTAMLYLGCVGGTYAGAAVAGAEGISQERFVLVTVALLAPALVGARLWFVLQNLDVFRREPRRLWRRAEGGSALYGGFGLSVALSVPVLRAVELPFWSFWDAASVTMLVGLVVTRVGCLMHGCCSGRATSGRLALWLPNDRGQWQRRFPTQIAEAAWGAAVVGVALAVRPSLPFDGALFAVVAGGYALGRLFLEPTRESNAARLAGADLAASAVILGAVTAFVVWRASR